jgi:hypothetical protein
MNTEEMRQIVEAGKKSGLIKPAPLQPPTPDAPEENEMWVVYRNAFGSNPKPIACFAIERMAKEFVASEPYRKLDFVQKKQVKIRHTAPTF